MNPERKYAPAERESHDQPANDNAISGVHKIDRAELTRKLHAAEARQAEEKRKREEAEDAVEQAFMKRGDEITDAANEGIALTPTETEALGEKNNAAHIERENAAELAAEIAKLKAQLEATDEAEATFMKEGDELSERHIAEKNRIIEDAAREDEELGK